MIKVGVIGSTGKVGETLVGILNEHPYAKIIYTESRKEGKKGNLSEADLIFLALPYGESKKYIPKLDGKKIIDLSIDHRSRNGWVYGLPELNKNKIKDSKNIANPGCYATSVILGLLPIKEKISDIFISSASGISGAGMELQGKDNFLIYKEGRNHPQITEIEKTLGLEGILFVPQRIDTAERGIVSIIFAKYNSKDNLSETYKEFYKLKPFIRIKDSIETKNVIGTNFCNIKISKFGSKVIVISALDNLVKGGAGQAVQNFNLMYGLDETTGLLNKAK